MKKVEISLYIIALIGLAFMHFHYPGSDVLNILSYFSLASLYFYLGFAIFNNIRFRNIFKKVSYSALNTNRIGGAVCTGIALSTAAIGILFKLQSYPGAEIMLYIGLIGIIPIGVISAIKLQKAKDAYYLNILKRIAVLGLGILTLLLIPDEIWLNWKYPNHPEYVKAVLNLTEDPNNPDLIEEYETARMNMYNSKNGTIKRDTSSDGDSNTIKED